MSTDKRKRAIRALAEEQGISYTAALRIHDGPRVARVAPAPRFPVYFDPSSTVAGPEGPERDAGAVQPYSFRLDSHALIVGPPGGGKTTLAGVIASQAREAGVEIRLMECAGYPTRLQAASGAVEGVDIVFWLQALVDEMVRRFSAMDDPGVRPPLMVVIDGLDSVLAEPGQATELVAELLRKARSVNIRLVCTALSASPGIAVGFHLFAGSPLVDYFGNRFLVGALDDERAVVDARRLFGEASLPCDPRDLSLTDAFAWSGERGGGVLRVLVDVPARSQAFPEEPPY